MDWKRDRPYSGQYDHRAVDNHTKEVIIPNNSLNETCSFILPSFLHSLKHIVTENDCFGRVRLFLLDGLDQLEKIEIRTKSFTLSKDYQDAITVLGEMVLVESGTVPNSQSFLLRLLLL